MEINTETSELLFSITHYSSLIPESMKCLHSFVSDVHAQWISLEMTMADEKQQSWVLKELTSSKKK